MNELTNWTSVLLITALSMGLWTLVVVITNVVVEYVKMLLNMIS